MSLSFRPGHRIFVFNEPIDMRAGFDRLSMLVRDRMKQKLVDGDLFVFLGNNRRRLKALCFDGTGLVLVSKRLETGRFMSPAQLESFDLTIDELNLLLRGGVIKRAYFGETALTRLTSAFNVNSHATARPRNELGVPS